MRIFNALPKACCANKASVDIGAGIGTTACFFNTFSSPVYCFEPSSIHVAELASYNLKNVVVYGVALSNKNGQSPFLFNYGGSHVVQDGGAYTEMVNIRTLDSYELTNIGLIKIDVEGHELPVLEGGVNTIRANAPIVVVEIIPSQLTYSPNLIMALLGDLGYGAWYWDDRLKPITPSNLSRVVGPEQEKLGSYDLLFVPQ